MYFPDRGCVHTLLTLYVYATGVMPYDRWRSVVTRWVSNEELYTSINRYCFNMKDSWH